MTRSAHILSKVSEIRDRIAEGNLRGAIKETIAICKGRDQELYNDAIIRSGEFYDFARMKRRGTIKVEDYSIQMNQLREAILEILDELEGILSVH